MKKKYSLWLNIVTICLCLCAVAIGVYSAQTASLTVNGSIGFTAHGSDLNVKVYKYGYADTADGDPIAEANRVDCTSSGALQVRGSDLEKSGLLGTMYFSDKASKDGKPGDIVVDFEITNVSKFNVLAKVKSATCSNENVMITYSTSVIMETSGTNATGKISVTLSLKGTTSDSNITYSNIDTPVTFTLKLYFEKTTNTTSSVKTNTTSAVRKFTDSYASTVATAIGDACCCDNISYTQTDKTYKNYVQAFPYYIEMGDVAGEPIKWLIVGKKGSDNAITKLEEADNNAFEKGYMLSGVTYCVLSETTLEDRVFHSSTTNSTYGTNANDYATSDIRAYLKSDTFTDKYSFSTKELNVITARSITEMYSTDTISVAGETETTLTGGQTFPTSTTSATIDTTNDKFWLLSQTEVFKIFEDDTYVCTSDQYKVLMSGRTTAWGEFSAGAVLWWLRSPDTNDSTSARDVDGRGYTDVSNVSDGGCAVRAAFLI